MKNLMNFFFSFDKLMKEKLVIAFFWLALIIAGLNYFSDDCLLYTSPSPRDKRQSRMPSSA